MSSPGVAFNPDDPLQVGFLSALSLGEVGNNPNAATEGYGGVDLSGTPTDQYGFPDFDVSTGSGSTTSAAGLFQFEGSTWDSLAAKYGLDFSNPTDQETGAWYEAQQVVQQTTGQSLETLLQNGDYSTIQTALAPIWPSVEGSGSAPLGLAADLAYGIGSSVIGNATPGQVKADQAAGAGSTGTATPAQIAGQGTGIIATIEDFFVRFGLIIVGGLIVIIALYWLLSRNNIIPSISDVVSPIHEAAKKKVIKTIHKKVGFKKS